MRSGMEILSPASYHHTNSNWFLHERKSRAWTHEENKRFEDALAVYDKDTPDRWMKVAAMIPGKTVEDVMRQYNELLVDVGHIEAGRIPIPGYRTPSFTLDWTNNRGFDGFKQSFSPGGRRATSGRPSDQERKKGVPWSEDEHRLFLLGLKRYGKGDWRNISRKFVVTRTPTQVASHAQKYFIRQLSGGKDKRRSSIHDITTVNITDTRPPSPDNDRAPSPDHSIVLPQQSNLAVTPKVQFDWSQPNNGPAMVFNQTNGNMFMSPSSGVASYGHKLQGQHQPREASYGYHFGPQHSIFQMQSSQYHQIA
ncbi:PREDICTED: transcription factor DIVARICATA-like [Nelumbo nucifera]|uniref:Transcription factor DIVARICATA-like n=1 Tax=Nelumbo nucifera TaxID=4432 RepID=A0A1U8A5K5_NELNU|nr:PREDICTED: transcription factor DIVARICATA-like [Nelumbo nucifera]